MGNILITIPQEIAEVYLIDAQNSETDPSTITNISTGQKHHTDHNRQYQPQPVHNQSFNMLSIIPFSVQHNL
jgi:hypothetical protein